MIYPTRQPTAPFRFNWNAPLAEGLVLWLPMIDNQLVDRIQGIVFAPSTTVPLVDSNGPGRTFINGSSTYLVSSTSPISDVGFTFACWYYPTSVSATRDLISVANSGNTTDYFNLQQQSSFSVRCRSSDSTSQSSASTTVGAAVSKWQLATGVVSATNARAAYLNGAGKGTSSGTRTTTGVNRIGIGAQLSSTPASFFDGNMSNVCVWNRTLSDVEIWQLWEPSTRFQFYNTRTTFAFGVSAISTGGLIYPRRMDGLGSKFRGLVE